MELREEEVEVVDSRRRDAIVVSVDFGVVS